MTSASLNRILLVEDDRDIQVIVRVALENVGGFTVEVCGSGKEALDKGPGFAPDLILLDVMMPGMDGPDTFKLLRELPETKETPVVFLTAKAKEQEVARYKQMGAIDVIVKPFDPMTIADTVRGIWERHRKTLGT